MRVALARAALSLFCLTLFSASLAAAPWQPAQQEPEARLGEGRQLDLKPGTGDPAAVRPLNLTPDPASVFRMPGEFERQEYLLLSCGAITESYADTLAEVAQSTRGYIRVILMYSDEEQLVLLDHALHQRMDSLENIYLMQMTHDTKWIRDYGPTILRNSRGRHLVIDWRYEADRPNDDQIPAMLAQSGQTELRASDLSFEGGNLLSNGQGVFLTTTAVLDRNDLLDRKDVTQRLRDQLGEGQVVYLEPLIDEPTGHVDMFVAFTDPQTVVVGQYDKEEDPENAALLDRNVARLKTVRTVNGPLKIKRIPMGEKEDGLWRTYTNCIFANGVLVVPSYQGNEAERLQRALRTYRESLPNWQIVTIDASELIEDNGALHCASLNIPGLSQPPLVVDPGFAQFNLFGRAQPFPGQRPIAPVRNPLR